MTKNIHATLLDAVHRLAPVGGRPGGRKHKYDFPVITDALTFQSVAPPVPFFRPERDFRTENEHGVGGASVVTGKSNCVGGWEPEKDSQMAMCQKWGFPCSGS